MESGGDGIAKKKSRYHHELKTVATQPMASINDDADDYKNTSDLNVTGYGAIEVLNPRRKSKLL